MFKKRKDGIDMTEPETLSEQVGDVSIEPNQIQNNQSKNANSNVKKAIFFTGLVFGLLVIAGSFIAMSGNKKVDDLETQEALETDIEKNGSNSWNLNNDKDQIAAEEAKRLAELAEMERQAGISSSNEQASDLVATQTSEPTEPPIDLVLERRLGGNVLVNDGDKVTQNKENNTAEATTINDSNFANNTNYGDSNERSLNFSGTTFSPRAANIRQDRTMLLSRGTTIPCVLVTKIVTDHAGLTKCQATKDVWSANGKTVLIERGSIFLGEQTAAMLQGQARVAVRWTQLETPKGVMVQIDSPSVGKLGAAGNAAWVNTHFWKRFGGSIMISLIGDFSNGLSKRIAKQNSTYTLEETQDNAESMAAEALRNSINIPPTGTINQGALLNIMVARDVDFRNVYENVDLSFLLDEPAIQK